MTRISDGNGFQVVCYFHDMPVMVGCEMPTTPRAEQSIKLVLVLGDGPNCILFRGSASPMGMGKFYVVGVAPAPVPSV